MSPPDHLHRTSRAPADKPSSAPAALPAKPPTGDRGGYVVALDVGGTGMKAALIDRANHRLFEQRRPSPREQGPEAMLEAVLSFAADLTAHGTAEFGRPPAAAGVAIPGILDEAAGVVRFAANLDWHHVPLRRLLSERLAGLPVALGHDVRTGGLAEDRLGAGRGTRRSFFVALGTGIAGAISVDGRIEPGAHGAAGEIGHVVVRPGRTRCDCGQSGCLESVASASAVGRSWAARSGDPSATAADAARAVNAGDPAAAEVWHDAVAALADGLLIAVTLLDPEAIVLGGGLAEAGDTLFVPLRAALRERITYQDEPALIPAELGDTAACLGAGLLAWEAASADAEQPGGTPDDSAPPAGAADGSEAAPAGSGVASPGTPPLSGPPTDTGTVSGGTHPQGSSAASTPRRFQQP